MKCLYDNCSNIARYGEEYDEYPTGCENHKDIDMINLVSQKCICGKYANYGYYRRICCFIHKKDNMINLNSKCRLCNKTANYGIRRRTHCSEHRLVNMINFTNKTKKCSECDFNISEQNKSGKCLICRRGNKN